MDVVAIVRLGTPIEDEARALAADLGSLPYEVRLKLKAGLPAVVLTTQDPARAVALHGALRRRGHEAIHCRGAEVVATEDMVAVRQLRLDPDALVSLSGTPARLLWIDIAALVRGVHRSSATIRKVVKQKKLAPARAVLTGGLMTSKTTTTTVLGTTEDDEAVLYVFPRTGGSPWSLRERNLQFGVLGDEATPTALRNFELVVERVRTNARQATYDDRLVNRKATPGEIDLLAHVIANAIGHGGSPFR